MIATGFVASVRCQLASSVRFRRWRAAPTSGAPLSSPGQLRVDRRRYGAAAQLRAVPRAGHLNVYTMPPPNSLTDLPSSRARSAPGAAGDGLAGPAHLLRIVQLR